MIEVFVLCKDHQKMIATEMSREVYAHLERVGKPAYLGGMLNMDVLNWLDGRDWDIKVGGWFFVFKFQDANDAVLFKLTWL